MTQYQTGQRPVRDAFVICGLILLVLFVFGGVTKHEFLDYDDQSLVYQNPYVVRGLCWDTIEWAFTHFHFRAYNPVTWLSHALDCQVFGLNPVGHHTVNLLLHASSVGLLFLVLRRMTGSVWRSAFVAALFGIHPLRVEPVAWIAERKGVLSGLFFMLTLLHYERHVRSAVRHQNPLSSSLEPQRSRYFWIALGFYLLGLLSKQLLVTLPCLLLLLDLWPLRRIELSQLHSKPSSAWWLVSEKTPFFLLTFVFSIIAFLSLEDNSPSAGQASLPTRLAHGAFAYVAYLRQTFWPANLSVFYPPSHPDSLAIAAVGALAGLLVISGLLVWLGAKRPYVSVGWLWFVGMLVPVSGVAQVGSHTQTDRYTYLPSIGLMILVVWAVADLAERVPRLRSALAFVGAAVVLALSVLTVRQVSVWKNTEALFTHAASVTPDNYVALATLGSFDLQRGDVVDAMAKADRVITIAPGFPRAEYLKATILQMQGKMQEAIPHLERSVGPEVFVPSRARLVLSLLGTGQLAEAEALLDQLLQAMPNNADAWLMKAALLREQGRTAEAVELFRKITESYSPQFQDTPLFNYEIAELFSLNGQSARASEFYAKALSDYPEFSNALNNFAWLLATDPAEAIRNGTLAVQYAERACELTRWQQPVFLGTLAAAYAEAGRFEEAVKMAGRARDRAKTLGMEAIANRNAELLEFYRQSKPYREGAN